MSESAVLTTRSVPTAVVRGEQPQAVPAPTLQQKEIIDKTWKMDNPDVMQEYGMKLFKHIFTMCPPAQAMFPKMKDVPFDELEEDEVFRAHSLQVMEAINLAITCLDDIEELTVVLKDLGCAHGSQGLKDAHFDLVGQALVATLEEGLGKEFTPEVKQAYVTFYGFVTANMKDGLVEYDNMTADENEQGQ